MIKIRAMKDGFRRAGEAFSKKGSTFPDDHFSDDQMEQLEAEPMLEVQHLPDLEKPESDEEKEARKVLQKMTNDKLKAECDAMGIAYPATATKDVLVDLILENTASLPEE